MKHAHILAAMAIMILLSGCVSDNVSLGCCLRANVSDTDPNHLGCVLYNTTDYSNRDLISNTTSCDLTNLNCNVTVGKKDYTIPICSGNELVSCIAPECTAMVCGDFAFTPRSAPGYSDMSEVSGNVPAMEGEGQAMNFYKGQCRFLPMDATLNKIMKASKSQINVFRIGVGGSFDEFEQYRYFFPMSDRFCDINPPMKASDRRVDRYMNYLAAASGGWTSYSDPIGGIPTDCLIDATAPPPFQFKESQYLVSGFINIPQLIPDNTNYKTTDQYRVDYSSVWTPSNNGYYQYTGNDLSPNFNDRLTKKIDDSFYKKALTIAHANDIYGTDPNGVSRAEFECDSGSNDCYSGSCDTTVYNRGLLQSTDNFGVTKDVVGDCNQVQDVAGLTKIVCGATKSVALNTGMTAPTITPVNVDLQPLLLTDQRGLNQNTLQGSGALDGENPDADFNTYMDQKKNFFTAYWGNFSSSQIVNSSYMGAASTYPWSMLDMDFYLTKKKFCTSLYGSSEPGWPDENDTVICSATLSSQDVPPGAPTPTSLGSALYPLYSDVPNLYPALGGAVFFGKTGDTPDMQVRYQGKDIIGYAIATPGDIKDLYIVKNCGMDVTPVTPAFPTAADSSDDAKTQCVSDCAKLCAETPEGSLSYTKLTEKCTLWCNSTTPDRWTQPCALDPESKDMIMVSVPQPVQWGRLMYAFEPYYEQRIKSLIGSGFNDGCGGHLNVLDGVISSMPWVMEYKKGMRTPDRILGNDSDPIGSGPPDYWYPEGSEPSELFLSSVTAQVQRERNTFNNFMLNVAGTSSCEMRRDNMGYWDNIGISYQGYYGGFYGSNNNPTYVEYYKPYYNVLYSQNIYLFKYNSTSKKLGKCDMDENTLLPVIKKMGWCKPCTTSTLALQNLSTYPRVYMPSYIANLGPTSTNDNNSLCTVKYDFKTTYNGAYWEYGGTTTGTDNVSCFNPHISDLQDYKQTIGLIGSPRTIPEATIIKEKAGDYMKSGILPVFDMSDPTNWIKANPDCAWDYTAKKCTNSDFQRMPWDTRQLGPQSDFLEYDFQRLFSTMGASIVIVDHVKNLTELIQGQTLHILWWTFQLPPKIQSIRTHAEIIKDYCPDCLVAFHVDSPANSTDFGDVVAAAMADPVTRSTVDLVTFDYSVTKHMGTTLGNESLVVDDLSSYGLASLSRTKKPTMVVGFNVADQDIFWKDKFGTLFDKVVEKQDKLVKSGIIGIIYAPARSSPRDAVPSGLVTTDSNNLGSKGAKFCAFQQAMYEMSTIPPNAMITKTAVADAMNCTECNALDINRGACGAPTGHLAPLCDDGVECTLPPGLAAVNATCPENTIVADCPICTDLPGTYKCTKSYGNGTKEHLQGNIADLSDDKWMDVLAGLPKPYKCCIKDVNATYTYTKQTYSSPQNKPVVFSKAGDPNMDCGFGTSVEDASTLSTFCNVPISPFKDYDINCCVDCADYPG